MIRSQFEELVADTLAGLPAKFKHKLANLVVVVEDQPTRQQLDENRIQAGEELFGLYEGVPLTEGSRYEAILPDKITIFWLAHNRTFGGSAELLRAETRKTVLHEIAHYFGINDARLHELGL